MAGKLVDAPLVAAAEEGGGEEVLLEDFFPFLPLLLAGLEGASSWEKSPPASSSNSWSDDILVRNPNLRLATL